MHRSVAIITRRGRGEVEKRRRGQIVRVRGKRSTGVQWPVWKKERQESGSRCGRDRDDGRGTTKTEKNNVARSVPRDIQKIRRENWEEGGERRPPG